MTTPKKRPTRAELKRKVRELQARIRAVRWLLAHPTPDDDIDMQRVLNLRERDWKILC